MQNMGTWNSTMALVFFCCFAFPFCLLILSEIVSKLPRPKTITQIEYVQLPPQTVYKTKTETKIVYKNSNCKKSPKNYRRKPKKRITKPKPSYISPIQTDAMRALVSIGLKKTDAKSLVNAKFDPSRHSNFEDLFRDCMGG